VAVRTEASEHRLVGEVVCLPDPQHQLDIDVTWGGQQDLVVPATAGDVLRPRHPRALELAFEDNIDQEPLGARVDAQERATANVTWRLAPRQSGRLPK